MPHCCDHLLSRQRQLAGLWHFSKMAEEKRFELLRRIAATIAFPRRAHRPLGHSSKTGGSCRDRTYVPGVARLTGFQDRGIAALPNFLIWCPRSASNRHARRRWFLKPVCLPFSPPGQLNWYSRGDSNSQGKQFLKLPPLPIPPLEQYLVSRAGVEPAMPFLATGFKPVATTNSAIRTSMWCNRVVSSHGLLLFRQALPPG